MQKVAWLMVSFVLIMLTGSAHAMTNGRACGGRTLIGDGEACCISGTVTLDGRPVVGAMVQVQLVKDDQVVVDTTSIVGNDAVPTYGFALHEAPLGAQPGDVVLLTVTYRRWTRTVQHTVVAGEQWLDIALDAPTKRRP